VRGICPFTSRTTAFLSIAIAVLALTGCGGGGTSRPSPFTGQWVGHWTDSGGDYGDFAATVAASGKMTISLSQIAVGVMGTGQGSVRSDGSFAVDYQLDGAPPLTATGTLVRQTGTSLVGSMVSQRNGQTQGSMNLDLQKTE
jgi:hypothetical protein